MIQDIDQNPTTLELMSESFYNFNNKIHCFQIKFF